MFMTVTLFKTKAITIVEWPIFALCTGGKNVTGIMAEALKIPLI